MTAEELLLLCRKSWPELIWEHRPNPMAMFTGDSDIHLSGVRAEGARISVELTLSKKRWELEAERFAEDNILQSTADFHRARARSKRLAEELEEALEAARESLATQ